MILIIKNPKAGKLVLFGTVLRLSCLNGRVFVECIIFGSLVHCNISTCCTEIYIPVSHCERIGCVMKLHQFHLKEGTRKNTFCMSALSRSAHPGFCCGLFLQTPELYQISLQESPTMTTRLYFYWKLNPWVSDL